VPTFLKSGSHNLRETSGLVQACRGVGFAIVKYKQLSHTQRVTYLAPAVKPDDPVAYQCVNLQNIANDISNRTLATIRVVPEVKFEKQDLQNLTL
jgi:hypothetical protein